MLSPIFVLSSLTATQDSRQGGVKLDRPLTQIMLPTRFFFLDSLLLSKVVPTGAQDDSSKKLRLPPSGRKDTEMKASFKEFLLALLETDHTHRLTASEAMCRIPKESEWLEIVSKKISL